VFALQLTDVTLDSFRIWTGRVIVSPFSVNPKIPLLSRNVPHPYTLPSSVMANEQESPAATCVNFVPSGSVVWDQSTSPGLDSSGLRPLSSSSSLSESSASMSLVPPSQSVFRPSAPWSLTPHVRILLSVAVISACVYE
jgi:hypothetical protein